MTRRQERLNSRILELLSTSLLSDVDDPRLQMVELTRVSVNRDASHAMIYFVSEDEDYSAQEVEEAFTHAKGFFRGVLAEQLNLRYTPDLSFRYDDAAIETQRVLDLFDQIEEERRVNPPVLDETDDV
ncbi:MAG: 30S ribosome-binding factor RbfA [Anaerolineales bacterium]|nr:30S ribosome-binding factor RbfA [Anaerolineales bacterium]MCB9128809.1 30S ribosome-binding factor RbfA [Ardenticatenales bacterium]MCB9171373.1 30S ribosome-binding factor RbfA [Ardenticatenales bacterium]